MLLGLADQRIARAVAVLPAAERGQLHEQEGQVLAPQAAIAADQRREQRLVQLVVAVAVRLALIVQNTAQRIGRDAAEHALVQRAGALLALGPGDRDRFQRGVRVGGFKVAAHHRVVALVVQRGDAPVGGVGAELGLVGVPVKGFQGGAVFVQIDPAAAFHQRFLAHPGAGGRAAPVAADDGHRYAVPRADLLGKIVAHGAEPAQLVGRGFAPAAVLGKVVGFRQLAGVGDLGVVKKTQRVVGAGRRFFGAVGVVFHVKLHVGLPGRQPDVAHLHVGVFEAGGAAAQRQRLGKRNRQRAHFQLPAAVGPGAGAGGFVLYGRRDFGIRFGRAPDGHALAALQGHSGLKQQSGFEHRFCLPFYRNRGCAARRAAALWSFGTFKISRLPPSVKRAPGRFAPVWRRANMFIW